LTELGRLCREKSRESGKKPPVDFSPVGEHKSGTERRAVRISNEDRSPLETGGVSVQ